MTVDEDTVLSWFNLHTTQFIQWGLDLRDNSSLDAHIKTNDDAILQSDKEELFSHPFHQAGSTLAF